MIVVNLDAINDVNRLADKDTQRYHEIVCLVPIKEKEGDIFFVKKWNSEDKVWYYQGWFDEYLVLGEEEFAELVESPEYLGYWSYSGEYAVTSPGQVKQHCAILAGEWFGSKDTQENDWYVDWESLYDDLSGEAWQLWIMYCLLPSQQMVRTDEDTKKCPSSQHEWRTGQLLLPVSRKHRQVHSLCLMESSSRSISKTETEILSNMKTAKTLSMLRSCNVRSISQIVVFT